MKRMTAREVERQLGLQYAQALQNNPHFASAYRDCKDDINNSLNLLQHYNKVTIALKNKIQRASGVFT